MKSNFAALLTAVTITLPMHATAQDRHLDRWQWEIRSGFSELTKNIPGSDLDTGFAIQGTVSVALGAGFGLYTGLDFQTFQSDRSFAGRDVAFNQRAYVLGAQWQTRFGASNLGMRLRAGATYGEIRITEDDYDDDIADSSFGLGWEAGIALVIGLPNKWMLTPGLRYRELSRNVRVAGVTRKVHLENVTLGIGLARTF